MSDATTTIVIPRSEQCDDVVALLPRLASFELPPKRHPPDLWQGDEKMVRRWFAGEEPAVHVYCAVNERSQVCGMAMFSLRSELLSGEPSAHLEALAVADGCEGRGVGTLLLNTCHQRARELGAHSMTLHVFDRNRRALGLYVNQGYEPELRRCIKWL